MESGLRLDGRVALVTGSTRGIGWATACVLAQHGATVVLHGRAPQPQLEERVAEIRGKFGVPAIGIFGDAADMAAIRAGYVEVFRDFRRLDVLVNNAGVLQDGLLGMIPDDIVRRTFDVNALGCICHLQEASRMMVRRRSGSIINVSSIMGRVGSEGLTVYGASKAAMIGATLSAAKELAPKNIRVNAVAPGFIDTDMARQVREPKYTERIKSIKMGRIGTPEDVANLILFLASDLSSYITGQVIGVDGGMLA
jgi:3-oxoacyl-[acyl-carrier protein] reductase